MDAITHFEVVGHRGARGLYPENTIPAYRYALEIGVDAVDMDVVMTRDKKVVVYHDLSLNPDITRDESGKWVLPGKILKYMSFEELKKYDVGRIRAGTQYALWFAQQKAIDGTRIPSLLEVINFVKAHEKKRINFQIEIKTNPEKPQESYSAKEMAKAVYTILYQNKIIDRTVVQAFDWQCLLELQKLDSSIKTAYLTDSISEEKMNNKSPQISGIWSGGFLLKNYPSIVAMIKSLGGYRWDPEDIEVTRENLKLAHKLGLKVVTWPMPDRVGKDIDLDLTKKLIKIGVDGIITDRPDKVIKLKK